MGGWFVAVLRQDRGAVVVRRPVLTGRLGRATARSVGRTGRAPAIRVAGTLL